MWKVWEWIRRRSNELDLLRLFDDIALIHGNQLPRDRARTPLPYRDFVNLDHRYNPTRAGGNEGFVDLHKLIKLQGQILHFQAPILRDLEDRFTRNAEEDVIAGGTNVRRNGIPCASS